MSDTAMTETLFYFRCYRAINIIRTMVFMLTNIVIVLLICLAFNKTMGDQMFKILPLLLIFVGKSSLLFAESPCSIDHDGNDRIDVPVIKSNSNGIPSDKDMFIFYKGHKIGVQLLLGDMHETQKMLIITVDGESTVIYDPISDQLYQHRLDGGIKVQCYFNDL